jgi:hypothetical protein
MPPRRCRERPVANATMEEEMRKLHASMDVMGKTKRRALEVGDVSEDESEDIEEEEDVGEKTREEKLLRALFNLGT